MSTCRHCQRPVTEGQTTCFQHADTDPATRAMISLPDEMQHTPPATQPVPTPVTAVLRVPKAEEDEEEALLTDDG